MRPAPSQLLAPPPSALEPVDGAALEAALAIVREREGVDFSGYRRSTLARRVRNRMISAGTTDVAAYLERLRADAAEPARLLARLTVKVSRFFRDRSAVGAVGRALAADLARAPRPLAVWSAGCGRGEEAWTLAIVLAELGAPAAPDPDVLGTDVDVGALAAAQLGVYPREALSETPPTAAARWLSAGDARGGAVVEPALRGRVAFARHDLARDPPPRRAGFDLVSCRNTLIYFDPPLQQRTLALLCDALRPGGLLWLGEAEWPSGPAAPRLAVVDRRARLFRLGGGDA